MIIETQVPLQAHNTFGIAAKAERLLRLRSMEDVAALLSDPIRTEPHFVLGGGSNIVITGDIKPLVIKVELQGKQLVSEDDKALIVQAAAGEDWHGFVEWTLQQGWPGLENLAMIPGLVGASPVQNIGAYGVELQDRFESLDAVDLHTGLYFTLDAAQCAFGYRDSVFKHQATDKRDLGLLGRALITQVRFRLPKKWRADIGYADLEKKQAQAGIGDPTAQQVFDWVCEIRSANLPNPQVVGNAGSFFKNPTVSPEQCADIIAREPRLVHYHLSDGRIKLAAAWLIDACGWRGKSVGNAAVYDKQALVIINKGGRDSPCTGVEVVTLAKAIQTSVYERFGIQLEPEPVVV